MSNAFEKSITITSDCPPFCISLAKSSTNAITAGFRLGDLHGIKKCDELCSTSATVI